MLEFRDRKIPWQENGSLSFKLKLKGEKFGNLEELTSLFLSS